MIERSKIETLVRERLSKIIKSQKSSSTKVFDFVNEQVVLDNREQKIILISPKAIITPSAQDLADSYDVNFKVTIQNNTSVYGNYSHNSIAIGADHGGFALKEELKKEIKKWNYEVVDVGTYSTASVDYPDFAYSVATMVASGKCKKGIMIDGVGIGSAMVANKVKGVRAANCHNLFEINNSREHNDSNVLTLGGRVIGPALAVAMVKAWLKTPFAGGRHQRRVDKIMQHE